MFYVGIVMLFIVGSLMTLTLLNKYLPKWFCNNLGWHHTPVVRGFDGCSFSGICPRCGRHVLQDSQGNWFRVGN